MRRIIEVRSRDAYYKGKKLDYIAYKIMGHFDLCGSRKHKYVVDVTKSETGAYRVCYCCVTDNAGKPIYFELWKAHEFCGRLCIKHITKLFPIVKVGKKYNVTVKKVVK
jgi:hypothetical protein